jgi:hypothetical protein
LDSIVSTIFGDIERYGSIKVEAINYLGDLQVTDQRIQSLLREKDTELFRLRDEVTSLKKLKSTINNQ